MFKIKYYLFLGKTIHTFFGGSVIFQLSLVNLSAKLMNLNEAKRNFTPEIKKELKKSKLKVLTNENDFLVKNLKKAG